MKKQPVLCFCNKLAITRCKKCDVALCEEHALTGIGPNGRKESLCRSCNRKQQPRLPLWFDDFPDS